MPEWAQIEGFSRYWVNPLGEVLDNFHERLVNPNQVTGGALAVRLCGDEGGYHTLSVVRLVAVKFVDLDVDPYSVDPDLFNTPIQLDNDKYNVNAQNILWRPRAFAWRYTHQFKETERWYEQGPIFDYDTRVVFNNVMSVGINYGLLFKDIYDAACAFQDRVYFDKHQKAEDAPPPVWPTRGRFAWV